MIASRLVVILTDMANTAAADDTIRLALACAVRPLSIRFAVPAHLEESLSAVEASVFFYDEAHGLEAVLPFLSNETHFLLLSGAYAFAPRWDALLLQALRPLGAKALLTGCMRPCALTAQKDRSSAEDAPTIRLPKLSRDLSALRKNLDELKNQSSENRARTAHPTVRFSQKELLVSEAYLPALKENPDENTVAIGRGMPLVCAQAPVKTLLVDPALLMGPVSFLLDAELNPSTLSMAAYVSGYSVHALHRAWLWPTREPPSRYLIRPDSSVLPGSTVARFEQLLGYRYGQMRIAGKAAMGLFIPEDTYPQRMPNRLRLIHKARLLRMHLQETHMPLMVSAFIDLPSPRNAPAFYTLRFGFLRRISSLPLLLYTGGSQERMLRASFPNTQSYPDHGLLPRSLLAEGMTENQLFARSKPLLMLHAAQKRVEFTHVAWLDMDTLPHPICPEAAPALHSLMDDRIHLATVNGLPDGSFLVIPVQYLPSIAKWTLSITQLDAELKRDFSEEMLWQRLFQKKSEWFAIHPMPRRRLLFLSLFERELLSHAISAQLDDLPAVYRPEIAPKSTSSKEN